MRKYVTEREVPTAGSFDPFQLCGAAKTSNAALAMLCPDIQRVQSYVTADKTFTAES
jgi:hypothetical protein